MEEKNNLVAQVVCFQMRDFETSAVWGLEFNSNISVRITKFLKNNVTSARAVSHNVLYIKQWEKRLPLGALNQQLSITCYQVSCYANSWFE